MGDYLKQGKDLSILKEPIGYLDGQEETILEHLKRAFSAIEERYLYDTALISYAGGDWEDVLQSNINSYPFVLVLLSLQ